MSSLTLAFSLAAVSGTVALLSLLMAVYRQERGLVIYAGGFIAGATGFSLLSLQGSGNMIGFILANALILLNHSCLAWGVRTLTGNKRAWPKRFWLYLAVWLTQYLWFTFAQNSYPIRAITISFMIIAFSFEFIIGLRLDHDPKTRLVRRFAQAVAVLFMCGYALRIALILTVNNPGAKLMDNNDVTAYTMFFAMVFMILWAGILLILDAAHLMSNLEDARSAMEKMATTDRLTGLLNRHQLELDLEAENEKAQRYQEIVSLIMFDIDFFKKINDGHGHDAGDRVLIEVGKIAKTMLRATDRLYRWGGEEFLVLCTHTTLEGAAILAEKIRQEFEKSDFPDIGRVTASFGVAELRQDETTEYWIKRLDRALYRAKNAGRNNVMLWDRTETYPPIILRMEWKKEDASGDNLLDGQHRRMMELGSLLLDCIADLEYDDNCAKIADELVDLTKQHFGDEEIVLGAAKYPAFDEHARLHAELIKEIETQQKLFHLGGASAAVFCNLLLQRILMEHLTNVDKSYRSWLRERMSPE